MHNESQKFQIYLQVNLQKLYGSQPELVLCNLFRKYICPLPEPCRITTSEAQKALTHPQSMLNSILKQIRFTRGCSDARERFWSRTQYSTLLALDYLLITFYNEIRQQGF